MAHVASTILLRCILKTEEWKADHASVEGIKKALTQGFFFADDEIRRLVAMAKEGSNELQSRSGSTVISALVTPTHIFVANCGDSRSVLVRSNTAVKMSDDHKPYNEGEKDRIEKAGGLVCSRRVNGDLAVSRSLGDFAYKTNTERTAAQQQISAEPEITVEERTEGDQVGP